MDKEEEEELGDEAMMALVQNLARLFKRAEDAHPGPE